MNPSELKAGLMVKIKSIKSTDETFGATPHMRSMVETTHLVKKNYI